MLVLVAAVLVVAVLVVAVLVVAAKREGGKQETPYTTAKELLTAQVASLSKTDAELVCFGLQSLSLLLLYIPALWAALVALLSGACLLAFPAWITPSEVVLVQLVIFLLLAGVFRFEIVLSKIIPKKAKTWHCANFCRRQFLSKICT